MLLIIAFLAGCKKDIIEVATEDTGSTLRLCTPGYSANVYNSVGIEWISPYLPDSAEIYAYVDEIEADTLHAL